MKFIRVFSMVVLLTFVSCGVVFAQGGQAPDLGSYLGGLQGVKLPVKPPSIRDLQGRRGIRYKSIGTWMSFEVTAYSQEEFSDSHTASGAWPTPYYTCAADDLPFGTIVVIDGHEWVVEDRFGAGHSGRLDLFFPTNHECFSWGRRWVEAEVFLP